MFQRTVIGSLPRLAEDLETAIGRAIKLQLKYGIQLISDGEQRHDMLEYFLQLPGFAGTAGGLAITDKVRPLKNVEEAYKVVDFMKARETVTRLNGTAEIKVAVTGPVTLGVTSAARGLRHYRSMLDRDLYTDIAAALQPIIVELIRRGAYVQIDEPGLSAGFMNPKRAAEILNQMVADLDISSIELGKLSLHVCGDLTRIPALPAVLEELKVPTLSLAFSGRREAGNLRLPLEKILERYSKSLGAGCVSVEPRTVDAIDSITTVRNRFEELVRAVGEQRIRYIHPDCGLKQAPLSVTERILENMMRATQKPS